VEEIISLKDLPSNLLKGKTGIISGIANNLSIAWPIAQFAKACGAEIILTYPNEAIQKRVEPLAVEIGVDTVLKCDVTDVDSMDEAFSTIGKKFDKIDFLVHSIAFADKNELRGRYIDTSLDNFLNAMNISCYSLTCSCKKSRTINEKWWEYSYNDISWSAKSSSILQCYGCS
jgi:enoyl-[acyl-carrier protein] reductase I